MVDRRLKLGALGALLVGLAVAALADHRRTQAMACRGVPAVLDTDGVTVVLESQIDGLSLRPGRVARCDDPGAAAVWTRTRALVRRAELVRPDGRGVTVHLAPRSKRALPLATHLEVHEATGDLVCGAGALETDDSVWIHELTHARIATGVVPRARGARDVLRALGEGAGDYVSASVTGRAKVGTGAVVRDLDAPPRLGPEGFAALAAGQGLVDPHAAGWDLAAALHRAEERRASPFRAAFLRCFDAPRREDDGALLLRGFLASCPDAQRAAIGEVLRRWAPEGAVSE